MVDENDSIYVHLTEEDLEIQKVVQLVNKKGADGAIASFMGTTRNNSNDKRVTKLYYEAYESMAKRQIQKLAKEKFEKYPTLSYIAVVHKIGLCEIGKAGIIICVSSKHRKESLLACHEIIDEIKATVPIWKKEFYDDGSVWLENKEWQTK